MNAFYNLGKDEIMMAEKIKDIQREVEMGRLIHEAGLSRPGLYERAKITLGSALVKLGQHLQTKYARSRQVGHTATGKYAV
jgi:hypothetical protein